MQTKNFTRGGTQAKTLLELLCSPLDGLQQELTFFAAVNILLSITAFLGNSLILVALRKESFLQPQSKLLFRCLATTDLLVGLVVQPLCATLWISITQKRWNLCRNALEAISLTAYTLCGVSLMTMTAISVDRLLALLFGLRCRQIVTLKRMYIIEGTFWVLSLVAALFLIFEPYITYLYARIVVILCLVISLASYTKIFRALSRHHQTQLQDPAQQQPSQPNALNMARYRKAAHSELWVQLALVVCYAPYFIVAIVIAHSKTYSSRSLVIWELAISLVHFNSTLNPFLYCWKISEIRQAVKQTIRQALCCPWS